MMFKENKKDIFYHIKNSSNDTLKEYLQNCDDINAVGQYGFTALMTCLRTRWGIVIEHHVYDKLELLNDWNVEVTSKGGVKSYVSPENTAEGINAITLNKGTPIMYFLKERFLRTFNGYYNDQNGTFDDWGGSKSERYRGVALYISNERSS